MRLGTASNGYSHRSALEAAVAGVDKYEILLAAQVDRLAGDQQADSGGHPDLAGDEHLGLQLALGVGERAAHLDRPRLRVDDIRDVRNPTRHSLVAQGGGGEADFDPGAHRAKVLVRQVEHEPQARRVGDHEDAALRRGVGAQLLARVKLTLDDHARERAAQYERLVDIGGRATVGAQPRLRACALGSSAGLFGLRRLQVLGRCDACCLQLLDTSAVLLREQEILLRLARLGLRAAELGRGEHG